MSRLSLDELVARLGFQAVDVVELTGRRRTDGAGSATPPRPGGLSVSATRGPRRIVVDGAVDHVTADADYRVAVRGTFTSAETFDVADETMTAFVETVGVPTLYPFLRASLRGLSAQLGAEPVVLDLLRPGQIQLGLQGKAGSN